MNRRLLEIIRKTETTNLIQRHEALEELWELADNYEKELADGTASFSENVLYFVQDIPLLCERIAPDGVRITFKVIHPEDIDNHWVNETSSS